MVVREDLLTSFDGQGRYVCDRCKESNVFNVLLNHKGLSIICVSCKEPVIQMSPNEYFSRVLGEQVYLKQQS